jgi:hypothetical protein
MNSTLRSAVLAVLCASASGVVPAQYVELTYADLESKSPHVLSKEETAALLPGASMMRWSINGSEQRWTNEPGGSFVISSKNALNPRMNGTGQGTWRLREDGKYCVTLVWKSAADEDWCRVIVQTSDGYYMGRSTEPPTQRMLKVGITK